MLTRLMPIDDEPMRSTIHLPPGFSRLELSCIGSGSCHVVFDHAKGKGTLTHWLVTGSEALYTEASISAIQDSSDPELLTIAVVFAQTLNPFAKKPCIKVVVSLPSVHCLDTLCATISDGSLEFNAIHLENSLTVSVATGSIIAHTDITCSQVTLSASADIMIHANITAFNSISITTGIGTLSAHHLRTRSLHMQARNGAITVQRAHASRDMTVHLGYGLLDCVYSGYETLTLTGTTAQIQGAFCPGSPAAVTRVHIGAGALRGSVFGFRGVLETRSLGGEIVLGRVDVGGVAALELRSPTFRPVVARVGMEAEENGSEEVAKAEDVSAPPPPMGSFTVKRDIHGDGNLLTFGYIKLDFDDQIVVHECGGVKGLHQVVGPPRNPYAGHTRVTHKVKLAAAGNAPANSRAASGSSTSSSGSPFEALMRVSQAKNGLF
ncbi:hypothetical protein BC830DRAFT_1097017 [Chytriomyces sp. MP71]|nr:hypothetical protein BC830DRAFT_1097017 [Chytriomyces sp. MP71]